jgi:hypothetical protein
MELKSTINLLPPIVARISRFLKINSFFSVRSGVTLEELSNSDLNPSASMPLGNSQQITLENVVIDLKAGHCFDAEYAVIQETSNWPVADLTKRTIPRPLIIPRTYDLEVAAVPMPSNGFYHWFIEDLPSVIEILEADNSHKVLVYQNCQSYILDFLTSFEINYQKFPRFSKFRRLSVPIRKQNLGAPNLEDVLLLKNYFLPKLQKQNTKQNVYISRLNSSRSPNFERELQIHLISKGWRVEYLEKLDLISQFNVFQNAKSIAGIHGAGLSGLVFADHGTPIIELYPIERDIKCFENLAYVTGHEFTRIPFSGDVSKVPNDIISTLNLL